MFTDHPRCVVHGFVLGPSGTCLRCRKEETQREAAALRCGLRKLYAVCGVLVGVLVVFATCRSVATAFADSRPVASAVAPVENGKLVVYTTSGCPACRMAKSWMNDHGVAYEERNIETDPTARAEVVSVAGPSVGVPTFVVSGEVQRGFNSQALSSALARHGLR